MDDGGGGASEADTGGAGAACEAGAGSLREPSTARAGAAVSRAGAGSLRDASTATGGAACTAAGCTGLDTNTSYLLKIKLLGNRKKARKDVKCFSFDMVVDSDLSNYMDFIESIVDKYPPGYLEVAHIQYYDHVLKTFPKVNSDQDLMYMFDMHNKEKVVDMFIIYCDPSETFEPITEWDFDGEEQPDSNRVQADDDYLRNPNPMNEHVSVDEETIYMQNEPINALSVVGCSDRGKEKVVAKDEDDFEDDSESDLQCDIDLEDDSEVEVEPEQGYEEVNHHPIVDYDEEDPPMEPGSTYPNMAEFKLALCQHAIKHEFEFATEKSSKQRFRGYCSRKVLDNCPWKIHASTTVDKVTVVVKKNNFKHDCSSTRRKKKVKNGTKHWVCKKVKDFLIEDATLGARELQKKIKEHHKVHIHYKRVYYGQKLALQQLYGDWDSSFNKLFRFKAQVENSCPGSLVIIDHYTINEKIRFRRFFFALKPCIDGFLNGCRPYLAVDSTFLTGRFKGQLASANAVDGHNWLYPVCVGVFDSETNENWIWFMSKLREAIGSPRGLAISTDAGQAVMAGVAEVFPQAEHRECMFHLVSNFKKKYHGKVFDDHLWAAAYSWNTYLFEKHWTEMEKAKPAATNYLRKCHKKLWTRSQFRTICKVDYVTNNLAESFNNWIKDLKAMNLDDFMDKLRQLLMVKWNQRRKIGKKLDGLILPHIIKMLNEKSRELTLQVSECSEDVAEVTAFGGSGFRFVVNLVDRTCSCRQWDVSGIPCKHALAFITSLTNEPIEKHIDLYYSIEKFRAAYSALIPALPDKSQWPKSEHEFFMHPPLLKAVAGRPKTERHKGCSDNKRKKGQHQCPICKDYGHHWHNCKKGSKEDIEAMKAVRGPPKKRKNAIVSDQSSIMALEDEAPAASMSFPPSQNLEATTTKKRKHADLCSEASKSSQSMEISSNKKEKLGNSNSAGSKRSRSGSNQPEGLSIGEPEGVKKGKGKMKKVISKKTPKKKLVLDSPAMGTRSKMVQPTSPAMSTRSKRRLSL